MCRAPCDGGLELTKAVVVEVSSFSAGSRNGRTGRRLVWAKDGSGSLIDLNIGPNALATNDRRFSSR